MQVFHDLCQIFLRLILTCHIGELDTVGRLHIDLRIALAHASHAEHHGVAAGLFRHLTVHQLSEANNDDQRQQPADQKA